MGEGGTEKVRSHEKDCCGADWVENKIEEWAKLSECEPCYVSNPPHDLELLLQPSRSIFGMVGENQIRTRTLESG